MTLVDVHCHLDYYDSFEVNEIIKRAKDVRIVTNSTDFRSCELNLEIARNHSNVYLACGMYPPDVLEIEKSKKYSWNFEEVRDFILRNKAEIVAIGETGIDFSEYKDKDKQIELFKKFLELACKINKPIIIHSRKAEKEVIEIIKNYECKKIMHCFSGNFKLINQAIEQECFFSIPTNIVRSEHFQKMSQILPEDKILTETDSPFLSPFKEKRNEPAFVVEGLKKIAELKKISIEECQTLIYKNFKTLFKFIN